MKRPRNPKPLSREEDYRDYEDRDEREGWPYSDELSVAGVLEVRNNLRTMGVDSHIPPDA